MLINKHLLNRLKRGVVLDASSSFEFAEFSIFKMHGVRVRTILFTLPAKMWNRPNRNASEGDESNASD